MVWFVLAVLGVALATLGAVALAIWQKMDVRVNVLVLAVAIIASVGMAFAYAKSVNAGGDETIDRLRQAIASDATTAAGRVAALTTLLDKERAFVRDLLTALTIAIGAIGVFGSWGGFLLKDGNDLKEPHNKTIDGQQRTIEALVSALGDDARAGRLRAAVDKTKEAVDKMGQD